VEMLEGPEQEELEVIVVMQGDLDLVALAVILEIQEGQEQEDLEATTETQEDQVWEEMVADLDLEATLEIQEDQAQVV